MTVTLETAKQYLRVDSSDDDELIRNLINTSEQYCIEILRLKNEETLPDDAQVMFAVLYALAFLYEHRESGNHDEMKRNLRTLLADKRKEVF